MVNHKLSIFTLLLAMGLLGALPLAAQKGEEKELEKLEAKKDQINKELEAVTKLLNEAHSNKEKTFGELKLIVKQMELRQSMIAHLNGEIKQAETEIERAEATITALEDEISNIQAEFSRMARAVYLGMHPHSEAFYFFSSESMVEGYYEIQYFREFSDYLRRQVKMIRRTRRFLQEEKDHLLGLREEKEALNSQEQNAMSQLKNDKKQKDEVYKAVKKKEEGYKKSQKEKVNALIALNDEIKIIMARINKGDGDNEIIYPLSKEFKANKGKFPWPIDASKGVIVTHFGRQLIDGTDVEVDVNGIDIATSKGQSVRAIYEGEVEMVKKVPLHGYMMIIRHGNYFTLYSDIEGPQVSKGDKVTERQPIATARTDKSSGETRIHFEMYLDAKPMNPEEWISRR